jgi:hypothetical protein
VHAEQMKSQQVIEKME